jgi:hypothetical protein
LTVVDPKPTATPGWYETWRKRIGIAAASTTAPGETTRLENLVATTDGDYTLGSCASC